MKISTSKSETMVVSFLRSFFKSSSLKTWRFLSQVGTLRSKGQAWFICCSLFVSALHQCVKEEVELKFLTYWSINTSTLNSGLWPKNLPWVQMVGDWELLKDTVRSSTTMLQWSAWRLSYIMDLWIQVPWWFSAASLVDCMDPLCNSCGLHSEQAANPPHSKSIHSPWTMVQLVHFPSQISEADQRSQPLKNSNYFHITGQYYGAGQCAWRHNEDVET